MADQRRGGVGAGGGYSCLPGKRSTCRSQTSTADRFMGAGKGVFDPGLQLALQSRASCKAEPGNTGPTSLHGRMDFGFIALPSIPSALCSTVATCLVHLSTLHPLSTEVDLKHVGLLSFQRLFNSFGNSHPYCPCLPLPYPILCPCLCLPTDPKPHIPTSPLHSQSTLPDPLPFPPHPSGFCPGGQGSPFGVPFPPGHFLLLPPLGGAAARAMGPSALWGPLPPGCFLQPGGGAGIVCVRGCLGGWWVCANGGSGVLCVCVSGTSFVRFFPSRLPACVCARLLPSARLTVCVSFPLHLHSTH